MRLKILSWNIHKGFSFANRRFTLKQAKEAMRAVPADIVFLQEVHGSHHEHPKSHKEWPSEPQFEYLADTVWPHFAYGKNAVYPAGDHGNAILSKYPITAWHNLDLTLHEREMRGLLHAEINVHGKTMHLMNTHINLFHHDRMKQLDRMCKYIGERLPPADPFLLGGDFNDWHQRLSAPLCDNLKIDEVFLQLYGRFARTFPSFLPMLPLDRMYFRNLEPVTAMVLHDGPWTELSDHLPVYAEVEV